MKHEHVLLWMDLETTGLDLKNDLILEVGWGIGTLDLVEWIEHPVAACPFIDDDPEVLRYVVADEFVRNMHDTSGLWEDRLAEPNPLMEDIEEQILDTLERVGADLVTLAGAGVSTFDLPLIRRDMPNLAKRLTYYTIDISVVERFMQLRTGTIRSASKDAEHRVIPDILHAQTKAIELSHLILQPMDTKEVP